MFFMSLLFFNNQLKSVFQRALLVVAKLWSPQDLPNIGVVSTFSFAERIEGSRSQCAIQHKKTGNLAGSPAWRSSKTKTKIMKKVTEHSFY